MKKINRGIIDLSDIREYKNPDGTVTTVYGGNLFVEEAGNYHINAYPQLKKDNPSEKIIKLTLNKSDDSYSSPTTLDL